MAPTVSATRVNVNVAERGDVAAVTFAVPAIAGDRYVVRTRPSAFVVSTSVVSEPPPELTAQVTGMFGSGKPSEFLITATRGADARLPTRTVCASPDTIDTDAEVDGPRE